MNLLTTYLHDAYIAWLGSAVGCCGPQIGNPGGEPIRGIEKPMTILHLQPQLIPPPVPESQYRPRTTSSPPEWVSRSRSFASRASSRGNFSVKRKLNKYNGMRRPHIGAPTGFRRVENASSPRRRHSFRPLQLSIYMPDNQLSPILPHFDPKDCALPPALPPAPTLTRSASAALSTFSIPRKVVPARSPSHHDRLASTDSTPESLAASESPLDRLRSTDSTPESVAAEFPHAPHALRPRPSLPDSLSTQELIAAMQLDPDLPQCPAPARLRAYTLPVLHERVKSGMQEKDELERRIRDLDNMIEERQILHVKSRPASIYVAEEPLPALAPPQPSHFLAVLGPRPKTAPSRPKIHIPARALSFTSASSAFSPTSALSAAPPSPSPSALSPTPPLRTPAPTPARKRSSFSHVSNWLFPAAAAALPVAATAAPHEGFYQCLAVQRAHRVSVSSASTLLSTVDGAAGGQESWTSVSEADTPPLKCEEGGSTEVLGRTTTFGARRGEVERLGLRNSRVGMAF